jgi:heme/copper-type cytochrome/quinol oxidase subunit 2/ribosomal protein L29
MADDKINIRELSFEELQEHLSKLKQQAFRSKQVFEWLWKKNAHTFEEMSNLSIELRSVLDANFFIDAISVQDEQISKDKTIKCAFEIAEGKIVEGVLIYAVIRYRRRAGDNEDGLPIEGNVPLEILWTAIPAIIVIGISVYSFDVYNNIGGFDPHSAHAAPMMKEAMNMPGTAMAATLINADASVQESQLDSNSDAVSKPAELIINVTGMQYAWLFTYADTDVTTGELHLPIGKTV